MISLRFDQLAVMTGGTLVKSDMADRMFKGVSIDSRTLKSGELFIAIKGTKHNGHEYIKDAIKRGAAGVIANDTYTGLDSVTEEVGVLSVRDSYDAMLKLAAMYRNQCKAMIIGITGSNGKTSTKEITFYLISAVEKNTYRSPGNLNNLYGVPLAIFDLPLESKVAIIEMGISTEDEMPVLADLVHPDVIVITNVGPSHLEFLKSVEMVARTKLELVKRASLAVPVIVNADDAVLMRETKKIRRDIVTFGIENEADFTPDAVECENSGGSLVKIDNYTFKLPLAGEHHVYNFLAAYATARTLGYNFDAVKTGDIAFGTAPMRGQIVEKGGITFFADCYNANPDSMKAGLKAFFNIPSQGRKILILGDMLELGDASEKYHHEIGQLLGEYEFDKLILVGKDSKFIMDGAKTGGVSEKKINHLSSLPDAVDIAVHYLKKGDFVMVKASRGIGLEAVINAYDGEELS